jgi:hypothetical protein
MRFLKIICFLGLVALGWAPAGHASPQPNPPNPKMESAKVSWRLIGIRHKGADCPVISDWKSENWLEEVLPDPGGTNGQGYGYRQSLPESKVRRIVAADPLLHKLKLDRFCTYDYLPEAGLPPGLPPKIPDGLADLQPARMALVPAGQIGDYTWETLADHFRAQAIGTPTGTASLGEWTVPFTGPQRVRLVFIDTQKDGEDVPTVSSPSRHGFTLAHMAKQLICRDAGMSCPVTIATRLALSHPRFDAYDPHNSAASSEGGNLGLVDELAAAIVREVSQWRASGSKEKLILNLSVGWDVELLDQIDGRKVPQIDARRVSQLDPSAQLVYNALHLARRNGVLVIAAAGNHRGGMQSGWPVLPAAWELRRPTWFYFPFFHKPVYAVGGVDWQGLPLPNARLGGMPRRVAFGDHGVAEIWGSNQPTVMYTGSSVSTAVASSIAAVVWQLRPDLKPTEVMRLINRSGNQLPGKADYYAWRNLWPFSHFAPSMKRLSLCSAAARACLQDGRPCEVVCPRLEHKAANLSILSSNSLPSIVPLFASEASLPPVCRRASDPAPRLFDALESGHREVPMPFGACPLHLLPDIVSQRWVVPQPDDPPCLSCSMVPPPGARHASLQAAVANVEDEGYIIAVEIDQKWWELGTEIKSASLDINRYSNGRFIGRTTYIIPRNKISPGLLRFSIEGDEDFLKDCTAALNLEVTIRDKSYSVQSPVYVDPP